MNKWKIGFWSCLLVLISVTTFSAYSILDQGVTITYERESYEETENDLNNLIAIINQTDMSKEQIKNQLKGHLLFEFMDFESDTVSLERIVLIFKDNNLVEITKNW